MSKQSLTIAHLYPELLNLYGDNGNITCLNKRLEWRGIEANVVEVHVGDTCDFANTDIAFIGGGSDREQQIVAGYLCEQKEAAKAYVEDMGVLVAVCGGYQLLGHYYQLGDEKVEGMGVVDMYTDRGTPRLIGNLAIKSPISSMPIVGYENHGGRTHLGEGVSGLGEVLSGFGNNGETGYEGCLYKNVVGTYIHGPLLPKNPNVADWIIKQALIRKYGECELETLDDAVEIAANTYMFERIMGE